MVLSQVLPDPWQSSLYYERSAVLNGEWWRLFSAHFVHLSWPHMGLNALALAIGTWLYGELLTPRVWLGLLLALCLGVSLGLAGFNPSIDWYAGFSGVATGLLVAGALLTLRRLGWVSVLVCLTVGLKTLLEQLPGQPIQYSGLAGIDTLVDAHLYGVLAGVAYCGFAWLSLFAKERF